MKRVEQVFSSSFFVCVLGERKARMSHSAGGEFRVNDFIWYQEVRRPNERIDTECEGGRSVSNGVKEFNQTPLLVRSDKDGLRYPQAEVSTEDGTLSKEIGGKGNTNLLLNLVRSENICTKEFVTNI